MIISTAIQSAIANDAVSARWLIWIEARNRTTGAREAGGVSTLEEDYSFSIAGKNRVYSGAGPIIGLPEIAYDSGTVIQNQRLTLSIISPAVIQMIRQYDAKFAPVEMRVAFYSTTTGQLIDTAVAFQGFVDGINIREGEQAACELTLCSLNRGGTKTLGYRKSDASQKQRNSNDNGRKYASIAGSVPVAWGQDHSTVFTMRRR